MTESNFSTLDHKLDRLIEQYRKLEQENRALRKREAEWKSERARLVQAQQATRGKVEAMIGRLKAMEQQ